jgi:hypothetical protein
MAGRKMNMLLQGIPDANVRNDDALAAPQLTAGGELTRFDRVLTNPPFSQSREKSGLTVPERFRFGWCPEGGSLTRGRRLKSGRDGERARTEAQGNLLVVSVPNEEPNARPGKCRARAEREPSLQGCVVVALAGATGNGIAGALSIDR